jgi:hypothetical protein
LVAPEEEDAGDVSEATVAVVDAPAAGRSVAWWLSWNMGASRVMRRVRTSRVLPVKVTRSGNVAWALSMTEPEQVPAATTVGLPVSAAKAMHVLPRRLVHW